MTNYLESHRDHPTDYVLRSARALGLTDNQILDCANNADREPELIEDELDFICWMIFSLMREYNRADHDMLIAELQDLMT